MQDSRNEEIERRYAKEDKIHRERMKTDPVYRKKSEERDKQRSIEIMQERLNRKPLDKEVLALIFFRRKEYDEELEKGTLHLPKDTSLLWFLDFVRKKR